MTVDAALTIARPYAERAVHRADTRTHGTADDTSDWTKRTIAGTIAVFGTADETLRLDRYGDGKTSESAQSESVTKHHILLRCCRNE